MMESRRKPRPIGPRVTKPSSSGPRRTIHSVMARSSSVVIPLPSSAMIPAMPHTLYRLFRNGVNQRGGQRQTPCRLERTDGSALAICREEKAPVGGRRHSRHSLHSIGRLESQRSASLPHLPLGASLGALHVWAKVHVTRDHPFSRSREVILDIQPGWRKAQLPIVPNWAAG